MPIIPMAIKFKDNKRGGNARFAEYDELSSSKELEKTMAASRDADAEFERDPSDENFNKSRIAFLNFVDALCS